jgi:hypothetical protein
MCDFIKCLRETGAAFTYGGTTDLNEALREGSEENSRK